MSLAIQCPSCAAHYTLADAVLNKRVRCKQCNETFTAVESVPQATLAPQVAPLASASAKSPDPLNSLPDYDLAALPTIPNAAPPPGFGPPPAGNYGSPGGPLASQFRPQGFGYSTPIAGPNDMQMRLLGGGFIGVGILFAVITAIGHAVDGGIYFVPACLIPALFVLGITAVISPDVVRAMGKYGGHLSWHYKLIAAGVGLLALCSMGLMAVVLINAGYQPGRPNAS